MVEIQKPLKRRTQIYERRVVMPRQIVSEKLVVEQPLSDSQLKHDYRSHKNRANSGDPAPSNVKNITIKIGRPNISRLGAAIRNSTVVKVYLRPLRSNRSRFALGFIAAVLLATEIAPLLQPGLDSKAYALQGSNSILMATNSSMSAKLKHDQKKGIYNFNEGFTPLSPATPQASAVGGGPQIIAVAHEDGSKGLEVTDPTTNVNFVITPKFAVRAPKQDSNRLIYPLADNTGWLVYTFQATQVKEDIVLKFSSGNEATYEYNLVLGDQLAARLTSDGSIGVFGSSLPISGQVSTGNDKDAQLLAKARIHAAKDRLLFTLPAPYIKETNKTKSTVAAKYSLTGNLLKVAVSGLNTASYPLTIDPSVYVKSAQKLMRGNNETNVDFDVTNNQILKGALSGARIPDWTPGPSSLPSKIWNAGTATAGGFVYVVGGNNGTVNSSSVYWAQFDTGSAQTIGSWSTNAGYNLPLPRSGLSLVSYNGYLYAIGGQDPTCAGVSNVCNTVYSSKLGANGEPNAWVQISNLTTERRYAGAVAYENQLFLYGGQTNATTGTAGVTTDEYTNINPNGTLGNWTTTTPLPTQTHGHSVAAYNGYVYSVGGTQGSTTPTSAVLYAKINASGVGTWNSTNSTIGGSSTFGGSTISVWNGYMYASGGCSIVDTSDNCTTNNSNIQVATINADGTVSAWTKLIVNGTTSTQISLSRYGGSIIAWRNALYYIGGCSSAMSANNCPAASVQAGNFLGLISAAGDVGPYQSTVSLPAALSGSTPNAGRMSQAVVVNNGYIYSIGGCVALNGCGTTTSLIFYNTINSDGSLATTQWTQTSTSMPGALAAMGATVYNNTVYIVGGTSGNGTGRTSTYYATFTASGDTGTWATANATLANASTYPFVFSRVNPTNTAQGYIYAVGGCTTAAGVGCSGAAGAYRTDIRRCLIATPGAAPSSCTGGATGVANSLIPLPVGVGVAAGTVYGNYVYLAGGADNTGVAQTDTVYYAQIDNSGNIVGPPNNPTATSWPTTTAHMTRIRRRSTAYASNGYLYILGGHDGSGTPTSLNDMQSAKIDVKTGDLPGSSGTSESFTTPPYTQFFTKKANAISQRWDFRGVAANGFLYAVGGCTTGDPPSTCTAYDGTVLTLQIYNNASGAPAAFTSSSNTYSTDRIGASSTIYNGYIYFVGGCSAAVCGNNSVSTVDYAKINDDGTLGVWATATFGMNIARSNFKLLTNGGYLYALGGVSNGSPNSSTEHALPDPTNGNIASSWVTDTPLPISISGLDAAIYNGYAYISGGVGRKGSPVYNSVYYNKLNPNGTLSAWTPTTSFTTPRSRHLAFAYNSTFYIVGGYDGVNDLNDVQYAKINADGTIGSFSFSANLPQPVSDASGFTANGYLYVVGGAQGASCTNNTYAASIGANTTISQGNNPTGLGAWSQSGVKFNFARSGAASAYANGKIYVLGGGCGSTLATTTDRIYYSTLLAQPQISRYSYEIDTDSDVFPSKTLFNGIDNGIGDSWQLSYRSATNAAGIWGRNTVYGSTVLGTPQSYVPVDTAGTNTNFSRYHFIELSIDVSQAFGYPEDVTRGPTITDLTFQFSADPNKRLRNGKTFVGGEQQPLDTPF
jgi:hypothetical protein